MKSRSIAKSGARIITFKSGRGNTKFNDYHNDHTPVARDSVVSTLMPACLTECSITRSGEKVCMRPDIFKRIAVGSGISPNVNIENTLRELMKVTGCDGERCILKHARDHHIITSDEAGIEEMVSFKHRGPTDGTLLSDMVIDAQLYAWMFQFPQFWAYNFNMRNWREKSIRNSRVIKEPDTFATINWADLYRGGDGIPDPVGMHMTETAQKMMKVKHERGIRYSACIINTDEYDGPGKHWMATFVDARDESETPHWSIEIFNSAAVRPSAEWIDWMSKTREELISINPRAVIDYAYVCTIWHQHSKTECGPYSLFYIWSRINRVPYSYFMTTPVPDQLVFEFRQHLFNDTENDRGKPFDFAAYARRVRIIWDKE